MQAIQKAWNAMADESIYKKLTPVLRDVLDSDDFVAAATLAASQVTGWDSLSNV
jgi:hypothetical protein